MPSAPNRFVMEALSEVSDAQLVTSVACSSEPALAEIYRRHASAVYGLARRVLNNRVEAEDVTQETFLCLWKDPDHFKSSRRPLRSFLLAQAYGRAVDTVHSLNARQRREVQEAQRASSANYEFDRKVWDFALEDNVSKALDELPRDERQAIALAYYEGYTYVEVARSLAQPEGTIKSRIGKGMQRLRVALSAAGIQGVEA